MQPLLVIKDFVLREFDGIRNSRITLLENTVYSIIFYKFKLSLFLNICESSTNAR